MHISPPAASALSLCPPSVSVSRFNNRYSSVHVLRAIKHWALEFPCYFLHTISPHGYLRYFSSLPCPPRRFGSSLNTRKCECKTATQPQFWVVKHRTKLGLRVSLFVPSRHLSIWLFALFLFAAFRVFVASRLILGNVNVAWKSRNTGHSFFLLTRYHSGRLSILL